MIRQIAFLFAVSAALLSQGCQAPAGEGEEVAGELELDSGKADGAPVRYRPKRLGATYAAFNQGLDEWVHGVFEGTAEATEGVYTITAPWYKLTPDTSTGLWWRVDIRKAEGEERVIDMPDKDVAFFVLQRFVGETSWSYARPTVTCEDGKAYTAGSFESFRAGDGSLQAKLPGIAGTCTSDYFWNDTQPEFAFAPIPVAGTGKITGLGQYEISITEEE